MQAKHRKGSKAWMQEKKKVGGRSPYFCRKAERVAPVRCGFVAPVGAALIALACLYSTLLPQARAAAWTALAHITGVSPLRGSLEAAYRSIIVG